MSGWFWVVWCGALVTASATPSVNGDNDSQQRLHVAQIYIRKTNALIAATKKMILNSLNEKYLPDLYFQLAEAYVQRSHYEYAKALLQNEEARQTGQSELVEKQSYEVKFSKKLAIETYDKMIADFPEFKHVDQAYFYKAHEYRELGNWAQAAICYDTLIHRFVHTGPALAARLVLAEHYLQQSDFAAAQQYLKAILAFPDRHYRMMALAKLGVTELYGSHFHEAEKHMLEVAQYCRQLTFGPMAQSLMFSTCAENLENLAWAYSEVHAGQDFASYFGKWAPNLAAYLNVLRKLARRYDFKEHYMLSSAVLREVIAHSRDVVENSDRLAKLSNIKEKLSDAQRQQALDHDAGIEAHLLLTNLEAMLHRPILFKKSTAFRRIDEKQMYEDYELITRDLLTKSQKSAIETGNKKMLVSILKPYTEYIDVFSQPVAFAEIKDLRAMKKNAALAHAAVSDYLTAAKEYEAIETQDDQVHLRFQLKFDLYNAILAYVKALEQNNQQHQTQTYHYPTLTPLQVLEAQSALKNLANQYTKLYPDDGKVPDLLFQIASVLFHQKEFDQAIAVWKKIIDQYPHHKASETSIEAIFDLLYKQEKLDDLASFADNISNNVALTKSIQAHAKQLAQNVRERKIEYFAIEVPDANFAEKMDQEYEANKNSQDAEDYLYVAIMKLKRQNNLVDSLTFIQKLLTHYPHSVHTEELLELAQYDTLALADYDSYVNILAKMAEFYKNKKPQQALYYAKKVFELHVSMGQPKQAETMAKWLMLHQTDETIRKQVFEKLIKMLAGMAAWDKIIDYYGNVQEDNLEVFDYYYRGLAYARKKDGRAMLDFSKAIKQTGSGSGVKAYCAKASFEAAVMLQGRFAELSFSQGANPDAILSQKLKEYTLCEKAYAKALDYEVAEVSIAAAYNLSELNRQLAAFIVSAPTPAGADAAAYKAALQEQTKIYRNKATQARQVCAQKTSDLLIFTDFAAACHYDLNQPIAMDTYYIERHEPSEQQKEQLAQLRRQYGRLGQTNLLLKKIGELSMSSQDYHLGQMVYGILVEKQLKFAANGLGLCLWYLHDIDGAAHWLAQAAKTEDVAGKLNYAGLLYAYGYRNKARAVLANVDIKNIANQTTLSWHPLVNKMLQALQGDSRAR